MLTEESDNSRTLLHMEVRSEGVRAVGRRLQAELRLVPGREVLGDGEPAAKASGGCMWMSVNDEKLCHWKENSLPTWGLAALRQW